ncbi:hypothetical protein H4219_004368 [Mycoemilia scoparia]|uniref:Peptidase M3A/M3B catalytic domain-containing protein n=1 Tax=Mycoemilia scoparia TaxID=417184 RepID=A0A9W7ZST3_9FUNG|nr:hypothetical protein H4219_004368 [Mycoemilia scoparia]
MSNRKTYIDLLLDSLQSAMPSGQDLSTDNMPDFDAILDALHDFSLESIKLSSFSISKLVADYDDYCKKVEFVEGIQNAADILEILHPNSYASEYFRLLSLRITEILYTEESNAEFLKAIQKYICETEKIGSSESKENLKKAKVFLKIFDLYNVKFGKNTNFMQYSKHFKDVLNDMSELEDNHDEIVRLMHSEEESDRRNIWMDLREKIGYTLYIKLVHDLNLLSKKGLNYRDGFDYMLDCNLLQKRKKLMREVDSMIEAIKPQYKKLMREISKENANGDSTDASNSSEAPLIKVWDFTYLYGKFATSEDFLLENAVKGGVYTLPQTIYQALWVFEMFTGYNINCDNSKKHFVWADHVKKYIVTDRSDGNPQMYIYADFYRNGRSEDPQFKYLGGDTDNSSIPCIVIYLPVIEESSQNFQSANIRFSGVEHIFEIFGKITYYTLFKPKFLGNHKSPENTRTMETPGFKLELFKHMFKHFIYEPLVLWKITIDDHDLRMSMPGSQDLSFELVSSQLKLARTYDTIIEGMNTLAQWKFAEHMFSVVDSDEFPKAQLYEKYHEFCNKYLLLDFDVNEITNPFGESFDPLSLVILPDEYFNFYAKLVYANIYYKLKQKCRNENYMFQELKCFTEKLCDNIRSNGENGKVLNYRALVEKSLESKIEIDIFNKYDDAKAKGETSFGKD